MITKTEIKKLRFNQTKFFDDEETMMLRNSEVKRKEFDSLLRAKMKEQNMLSEASKIMREQMRKLKTR